MFEHLDTSKNLPNPRPSWDEYFMELAFVASKRSHDAQTKHGALIVRKDKLIMGIGYNGFPRGVDDSKLCNVRPGKHFLVLHSEVNAVYNCIIKPAPEDEATCYVTGTCCIECLKCLSQNYIKKVVMADRQGSQIFTHEYWMQWHSAVELLGMEIRKIPVPGI